VENMRSWDGHRRAAMVDGFSVDQSVLLSAGDRSGIERLVQYMVRCPLESVSTGQGHRYRTGSLQGREATVPSLSRPEGRRYTSWTQPQFPDPITARLFGRILSAHSAQRLSYTDLR
jgi:hypothetical protein